MSRPLAVLRVAAEVAGVVFLGATLWYGLVLTLITGLWIPASVVVAAVGARLVLVPMRGRHDLSRRTLFDGFLLAQLPAAALVALALRAVWPIDTGGFDAHGFGMSGGELNAVFYPPLHLAGWIAAVAALRPLERAGRHEP